VELPTFAAVNLKRSPTIHSLQPSELTGPSYVSADDKDDDGYTMVMRRKPKVAQSPSPYVNKSDSQIQHKATKGSSVNSKVS